MRYLFIIQGEGRGHLTQALSMKEMLQRNGHEVTEMLVGMSSNRKLPHFFVEKAGVPITTFESPNFLPTVDNKRSKIFRSIIYNITRATGFWQIMQFIRACINNSKADAVINFYELLTGLTYGVLSPNKPYFCIGHQYMFLHRGYQFPPIFRGNLFLLKFFTRLTSLRCERRLALSFSEMDRDDYSKVIVVPPLLRPEVLRLQPEKGNFILGYMVNSGFSTEVSEFHKHHTSVNMHFFWDKKNVTETYKVDDTLTFHQVNDTLFLEMMKQCNGYATTAGFESVCEAMYLGKPVMMVPAHIEQDCNAYEASLVGAGVVSQNFNLETLRKVSVSFSPNKEFPSWVRKAEYRIIPQLKPREYIVTHSVLLDYIHHAYVKLQTL